MKKQTHFCQVDGCSAKLSTCKAYCVRYRVCQQHLAAASVLIAGVESRFCQQCGRFQQVDEFDGIKRSCRARLAHHNSMRQQRRKEAATAELQASTVLDLPRSSRPSAARQPGTFGAMFDSPPNSPEHAPEFTGKQQGFAAARGLGMRDAGIMRTAGQPGPSSAYAQRAGSAMQQLDSSPGWQAGVAAGVGSSMQQDVRFGSSRWTEATALEFFMSKSKAKRQPQQALQSGKRQQLGMCQNPMQHPGGPLAIQAPNHQHSMLSQQLTSGQPNGAVLQQVAIQSGMSTALQAGYNPSAAIYSTSTIHVIEGAGSHQGISTHGPAAGTGRVVSVSTPCTVSSADTGISDETCFGAGSRNSNSPSTASNAMQGHVHGLWLQQQPAAAALDAACRPGAADGNTPAVSNTQATASNPAVASAQQPASIAFACALPLHTNGTTSTSQQPTYSSQHMPQLSAGLVNSAPALITGLCIPHTAGPLPWGQAVSAAARARLPGHPVHQMAHQTCEVHSTSCAPHFAPSQAHLGSNASADPCWAGQAMTQHAPAGATFSTDMRQGRTAVQEGMLPVLPMPAAGQGPENVTGSWAHTSILPQQQQQQQQAPSCPASGNPSFSSSITVCAEAGLHAGHAGILPPAAVPSAHGVPADTNTSGQQHELHARTDGTNPGFNHNSSQGAYAESGLDMAAAGLAAADWAAQEGLPEHDEEFGVAVFNLDSDELLNHWDTILAT